VNAPRRLARLVARTARGLSSSWAHPDDGLAESVLVGAELEAYRSMDPRDRDHAGRVARSLLAEAPAADPIWVRAALLHDVGKAATPYRLWERILVHLWAPEPSVAERFPPALAAVWRRHRDHAALGADALRALGVDERVVDLVARHHDAPGDDEALHSLRRSDEAA
jgi:putative nucleotidyltransferase with HDIG domain